MEGIDFEAGRAEALRALCAIFSAQPCGVPFLPIYLARFYQALSYGLQYDPEVSQILGLAAFSTWGSWNDAFKLRLF